MTIRPPGVGQSRVLRVPRGRGARLLLTTVGFTVAGGWLVTDGGFDGVVGWVAIAFFGVLGIPALGLQLAAPPRLELDHDGFTLHQPLRRPMRRRWDEVGPFSTWRRDPAA